MATSSDVLCGVCDAQHITKCSDVWCPECEEGLCLDCKKHHSLSKATRTHGTIPVDQYQKLPSSISQIVHHCKEHGIKYTNYCPHHDILCCPVCISTTHVTCTGYLSVQQIIKTAKTSTSLDNMEQSLNDIESNIEKVIHNRDHNRLDIKQQKQNLHDDVKKLRVKISSYLDTLEQHFRKELNAVENGVQYKIESLIQRLSKQRETVHELKINITALKEHASDLQTFIGSKTYQPEVVNAEQYMESLSEDGSLNQLNLKCNIDDKIWKHLGQIPSFGPISIETSPPTLIIKTEKNKQAQISAIIQQPSPKSINDIKLSLLNTYKIPNPGSIGYRGCIIHSNGKLILAGNVSSKLVVLNDDGTLNNEILCTASYAHDVTTIDDRTVAMSTSDGIYISKIDSKQPEKVINTSRRCYGITYHTGALLWCEEKMGLQKMGLSDGTITTLVKQDQLPDCSYVTTYGDNIYQTNYKTKTVTCYTIDGQRQWEYKNEALLNDPKYVTVDNNSNIYVTSANTNSVVVLAPDGRVGRQLLSKSEGLDYPRGIHYEKNKHNLLLVNRSGPAFLHHIS